jgi:hypothetical protein
MTFVEQNEVTVLRELRLQPTRKNFLPKGGLTARTIAQLTAIGALRELAVGAARRVEASDPTLREPLLALVEAKPGRRAGKGGGRAAEIAAEYSELVDAGVERPYGVLAERHHLTESTIRGHIRTARQKGLLPS